MIKSIAESSNINQSNMVSSKPKDISKEKRTELMEVGICARVEDIIDFDSIFEEFEEQDFVNTMDLLSSLQEDNYFRLIKGPCIIDSYGIAEISKDKNGIVRYVSTNKTDNTFFYLTVVDMMCIIYKETPLEIAKRIFMMVGADCQELMEVEFELKYKLKHNLEILSDEIYDMKYNSIRKILGSNGLRVLRFLHDEAIRNLYGNKYKSKSGYIFFSSIKFSSKALNKGCSTVSSYITILNSLGFLRVCTAEELPDNLLIESHIIRIEKKWIKPINFYLLNRIDQDVLEEAEIRAKKLIDEKIRVGKTSHKRIVDILGFDYKVTQ